jgi:class 3 adenylate cyclase
MRPAAILVADVVGYSLLEADEADTMATLKTRLKEVIEPPVARQGRIFKAAGLVPQLSVRYDRPAS